MRGLKEMTLSLLLLQLLILRVTTQGSEVVKPGCLFRCANVTIPFPFGIGEDCYLDKEFAVNCQENGKPVLNSINGVEILEISVKNQTMLVNHPVFGTCETNKSMVNETVNLEGTPFFFSSDENMFTGLGCGNDVFTWFEDSENPGGTFLSGCYSVCVKGKSDTTRRDNSCTGINCCQTGILSSFQVFNITTRRNNDSMHNGRRQSTGLDQQCRYAFIVEQNWFLYHRDEVPDMRHVPVVLDWRVNESSSIVSDITGKYPNAYCQNNSLYNNTAICRCDKGYEGNPYLQNGCTDIDECERFPSICPSPLKCKNTVGNYTCYYPVESKSRNKMILLGVGISTSLAVLFITAMAWWLSIIIKRRKVIKRKKEFFKRNGGLLLQQQLTAFSDRVDRCTLFTSDNLDKVTDHFNKNRILGQGGQGTVYKGMTEDGRIIAVKKSTIVDEWKLEEFINEVVILSQINHRNVVKLLGCCLETDVPLLVYEFVPNGTLFQYLHKQIEEVQFTWDMRLRIATEVAEALSYLHSAVSIPIYHRDIKSANILLDEKLRAKVADFGTSKSFSNDQTHVTTKVMGTFGYLDPEYHQSGQFTSKSDVYSYGVVLIELLTGKTPMKLDKDGIFVSKFIASMEENCLYEILDTEVRLGKKEEVMTIASLAQSCLNLDGKKRPTMKEVAIVLEKTRASQKRCEVEQKYDENKCDKTKINELSDITYPSTSSTSATVGLSVDDEEPRMTG